MNIDFHQKEVDKQECKNTAINHSQIENADSIEDTLDTEQEDSQIDNSHIENVLSVTHSEDKRYSCNQCNKTFSSCDYLIRHRITHSEVNYLEEDDPYSDNRHIKNVAS